MSAGESEQRQDEIEQRVTPLELFFDLVFVFAITQVTGFIAEHPTWTRLVEGSRSSPCSGSRGRDMRGWATRLTPTRGSFVSCC